MNPPETRYAWNGEVSLAYQVVGPGEPDLLGIEVRAGLHTGEMERIDSKVVGVAVNIGARVAAMAAPSEVLVSRTVKDLMVGSDLRFEDRGSHELKGVPGAWKVYAVARQ
jgi:class 3 adenylate cyclase